MARPPRTAFQDRGLRFFNDVLYDPLAPLYGAIDVLTLGAWWRLVRRALDHVPADRRVLEVGFGPGRLHEALARRSQLCVGVDLAPGMCRFTRRRLLGAGLESRVCRGSVLDLPFADQSFDLVVSTFAFSGFPSGAVAMGEMARVLSMGGRVVLVDIALPRDGNRAGVFWARLWERVGDYLYDYAELMRGEGLVISELREFGPGNHIRAVVGEKRAAA